MRVWEQVPSSRRILEDTNKFLYAIRVISDHSGIAVAGLGNRKGHRNDDDIRSIKKRGGARVKGEKDTGKEARWVHDDAAGCFNLCIESSLKLHALETEGVKDEEKSVIMAAACICNNGVSAGVTTESSTDGRNSTVFSNEVLENCENEIISTRPCEAWL